MKSKTVKATIWSLLDTYSGYALKLVFAIAITRILTPRDYGLVAYTGLFMGIAAWLSDWGFGTALIQKKSANDTDFSTGFWFNVLISTLFFLIYFISAPYIASFFKEPELNKIMKITSLNLIFSALSNIQSIKLIKSIQFKKLTILNFFSSVISGSFGLYLAFKGFRYWALIIQTLSANMLRMLGLWFIVKWIPHFEFRWNSFTEQFHFGVKVFLAGLLESIFREIHSLVIGKIYQTDALGNYSRGKRFFDLFIVQTGIAFNKVLYPTMLEKAEGEGLNNKMYTKTYVMLFFVMAPLSLFLILLSKSLVIVLLTNKWIEAVPFMQLYFVAGFFCILTNYNSITILSANKPNFYLTLEVIQKILFGLALFFTYKSGISAIIVGWLIAYFIHYLIYEYLIFKLNFSNPLDKYLQMMQIIICILPSVLVFLLSAYFIGGHIKVLIMNIIVQPLLYLFLMRICGFVVYKEFIKLAKPFLFMRFFRTD